MIDIAAIPASNWLRLFIVPLLLWASVSDIRTRRVDNRPWKIAGIIGVIALAYDAYAVLTNPFPPAVPYFTQVALTLAVCLPFAYGLWRIGGFGGADAKALMAITVGFPHLPSFVATDIVLPHVPPVHTVFPVTVLLNGLLVSFLYMFVRGGKTAVQTGEVSLRSLIGEPVRVQSLTDRHGKLLESTTGRTMSGTDLDTIKQYIEWNDISSISELSKDSLTTGEDEWNAATFVDEHDDKIYTPTAEELRDTLELLASRDTVWMTPGLPFLPYLTVGLVISLVFGSITQAFIQMLYPSLIL